MWVKQLLLTTFVAFGLKLTTQAELAAQVGVTRQTLIAIEQAKYSPTLELAFKIAKVFAVPLDEVFQFQG
jgi:putative transcriptional regulator